MQSWKVSQKAGLEGLGSKARAGVSTLDSKSQGKSSELKSTVSLGGDKRVGLKCSSSLALGQKLVSKFGLPEKKTSAQVHPRLNDKNYLCLNEKSLGKLF